jgi:hypothetical protein
MPERDRESVGLTPAGQSALSEIEAQGWFAEGADIARFCLAYAVRAGVTDGSASGTETRWAAGNFDKSGEIRMLLSAFYPDSETPVRLMEHLIDEGLRLVSLQLRANDALSPADLLG